MDGLDIDSHHDTVQHKDNTFILQLKQEFLAFYLSSAWTPTGISMADLVGYKAKGSVTIDSETRQRIKFYKNLLRKANGNINFEDDTRDFQTFQSDYASM